MLSSRLLVVHDARAGGEDNVAELTRRKQLDNPLLEVYQGHIVARRDDTRLIETAVELDDDFAVAVIVNFFEFTNIAFYEQLVRSPK